MSRDPLGYSEGPNLYAYVGNNPSTFTDPWGLKASQLLPSREGKNWQDLSVDEIFDKAYAKWDWNQFGNAYSESAQEFSQPFVDTAQCFQNDVLVCSAETFTPYGDLTMIQNYAENFDSMTNTQKWVQGGLMVGAILTPGNSTTNKSIVKKVDDVIEVSQGLNKNINWSKINTYGMIKPEYHYQKHGINVSPQQYFNDALSFGQYAFNNMNKLSVKNVPIKSLNDKMGYKIIDPKTGKGGFFGPEGELISFWYQ